MQKASWLSWLKFVREEFNMKKFMNKMCKKKQKGFTLVELLIVIIIIGILAGMMMLTSGSATDKAEATKIVADLRSVQAAVVMYYAENNKWPASADSPIDLNTDTGTAASIDTFLDNKPAAGYKVVVSDANGVYAQYNGAKLTSGVQSKLAAMAADAGLLAAADGTTTAYSSGTSVYKRIKAK